MALPQSINYSDASEDVVELYDDIKSVLDLNYVPLMFRYLANYPSYLDKLWSSIRANITDPSFQDILSSLVEEQLRATEQIIENTPSLKSVAQQLIPEGDRNKVLYEVEQYLRIQTLLSYISVGIRERTKGWAIGAKYLPETQASYSGHTSSSAQEKVHSALHEMVIAEASTALAMRDDIRESLMKFIVYVHEEFTTIITQETYLFTRVQTEKIVSRYVDNMPHPLFASYNEVAKSVPNKTDLQHIFYFLSEKFPVSHTVAALMRALSVKLLE